MFRGKTLLITGGTGTFGNVRDPNSLRDAMIGVDFVFHAAALKQVPSYEFFPREFPRQ
jgi:UDP-N-acetylglucosamine 4,6-dehydratase/5-epimerase